MREIIEIEKNPKDKLAELLYLDIKNYNRWNLVINNKYKHYMPHEFYVALSRGYKSISFEDLKEEIVYEISEGELK